MSNVNHKDITAANIHVASYVQSSDPGATGAGIQWIDTSTTPATLKKRNAGNSGWDVVGAGGNAHFLVTQTEASLPNATVAAKNADGSGLTWTDNAQYVGALAIATFVNAVASGLTPHADCQCATTTVLPAGTYANGAAGVGATFTVTATGTLTIDGHLTVLNDRVLVKNQVSGLQNGVYKVTTAGAVGVSAILTRDTDSDSGAALLNALYAVIFGTTNASTQWYVTNATAPTIGTDAITFAQFTSGGNNGNGVKVDASLTKAGNTLGRAALTGDVTASAGSNATTLKNTGPGATGPIGSATVAPVVTIDAQGRVTGLTSANITQPAAANPTGTIGATAVNGSAATFMRSDGAPPLAIASLTGKTTPVDADTTVIADSAASSALKSLTWANIKATLLAYFNTIFGSIVMARNHQTGTTYTLAATDVGGCVDMDNSSPITVSINKFATVPIALNGVIDICQRGTGQVTVAITGGSGVTLNAPNGAKTSRQFSHISVYQVDTDIWDLSGDSAT